MDKSIVIEPIKNSVDVQLVKVETLLHFVAPVQNVAERKEVD
ncbi:hypothetical protein [Bacillus sp. 3255]|nr:hypothetical protein [Bacillus sp. 3255]MDR6883102.1 hypothetical protein [Bacillus sp. 3255]